MQPLVLHPPSLTSAQFGQPRFDSGPERLLNRSWTTNARGYSPRAPLSHQSMSGSPRPEEPSVTSGEPNPVAYPPVTSPQTTASQSSIPAISGPSQPPAVVNDPLLAPNIPSRYEEHAPPAYTGSPIQHQPHHHQLHHHHQQQHHHHHHHHPEAPSYPLSALEQTAAGPSNRVLAQKSTRRTKAHVASACVNCKKKHLGCDPARPCRRCVLAGKASSCVDVTHKKRGRPPLKAEDSSLRPYTANMENPNLSVETQPSMATQRNVLHRATSSRELRPMTDLHGIGDPSPTAASMRIPRNQPHRWSASVFPLTRPMDPSPPVPGSAGRRPFSSSGPASYAAVPSHPPPAFVPMASGFNPVLNSSALPPGMERRYPPYAGPALPPPSSPSQPQPTRAPYSPYTEAPASTTHQPMQMSDPRIPPGPREPYLESPVRLPPIHQATASPVPNHAHRLSDPYPTTWMTASSNREENREPRSPLTLQRPMGPNFTHTTPRQHQRSSSTTGPLDPIPRHLGPIDLPSPIALGQSPPVTNRAVQPNTEVENSEPRPIKRRKMALDDMVNG
ncbi:hypothetical protein N7450_010438 [Penicillium hetheringtonii]|uniref:Zn(2)-C6 fungal-type domain-containing protein n=1 Tax=Penicillium hetheringtonii TaxID=911720 RepID=A0AAD6GM00_9EURO|nr:hypothetical protein N7450_010438 [Penicillium hetheringtonii]